MCWLHLLLLVLFWSGERVSCEVERPVFCKVCIDALVVVVVVVVERWGDVVLSMVLFRGMDVRERKGGVRFLFAVST